MNMQISIHLHSIPRA